MSELKCRFCEAALADTDRLNTQASNISIGDNFSTFQRGSKQPACEAINHKERRDGQWPQIRHNILRGSQTSSEIIHASLAFSHHRLSSNNCCVSRLFIYLFPTRNISSPGSGSQWHGSICLQSGPTIEISELKWSQWPVSHSVCTCFI